ncbi:uncharacterized protein LOC119579668 [Penaeus monodon]|uniref:uncharacterized protein LOC119579668 n=1 Tax=Penaeus monodon TaxID=6687 RepID=UPI0018A78A55|nr:uncharacterized protein LOC119579668 [Penaeus monodon]
MKAGEDREVQEKERVVKMQGEIVKQPEEFKYLGSTVQADGGSEREVTKWIQAGWRAWKKITGVMCDRKVSDAVKGKIYKTGHDERDGVVAVTKAKEGKIQVAEMKMLRWSLGLTRQDRRFLTLAGPCLRPPSMRPSLMQRLGSLPLLCFLLSPRSGNTIRMKISVDEKGKWSLRQRMMTPLQPGEQQIPAIA